MAKQNSCLGFIFLQTQQTALQWQHSCFVVVFTAVAMCVCDSLYLSLYGKEKRAKQS